MQWFCWGVVGADASSYSAITITSLSNNDLESFFFCGQSQINWKTVKETVRQAAAKTNYRAAGRENLVLWISQQSPNSSLLPADTLYLLFCHWKNSWRRHDVGLLQQSGKNNPHLPLWSSGVKYTLSCSNKQAWRCLGWKNMQNFLEIQGTVPWLGFETQVIFWVLQKKASDSNDESESNQGGRLVKLCAFEGKYEENEIIPSSRVSLENSNIIMLKYFSLPKASDFLQQLAVFSCLTFLH